MRDQRLEMIRRDVGLEVRVERTRKSGNRGGQRKGLPLEAQHVLAGKRRELLVLADRLHGASIGRRIEPAQQQPHQQHDDSDTSAR